MVNNKHNIIVQCIQIFQFKALHANRLILSILWSAGFYEIQKPKIPWVVLPQYSEGAAKSLKVSYLHCKV